MKEVEKTADKDVPAPPKKDVPPPPKVIRAKHFRAVTGIPDSTRADWENPRSKRHKPSFPKKIRLGLRCVGYLYDEVMAWLEDCRGTPA